MSSHEMTLTDYALGHHPGPKGPELTLSMRNPPFARPDHVQLTREGDDLILMQGSTVLRLKRVSQYVLQSVTLRTPFNLVDADTGRQWRMRVG